MSTGKSAKFLHPLLKGEKVSSSGNDSSPSLNFAVSPQKTDSSKSAEGGNSSKSMHSVAGAGNFTFSPKPPCSSVSSKGSINFENAVDGKFDWISLFSRYIDLGIFPLND